MQSLEILRDPKLAENRPVIVIYGDEPRLRRAVVDDCLRVNLGDEDQGFAVTRFAGDSAKLADVLDEVRTLPFLSKRRVVIVEDADPFVSAHRKELERYAEHPSTSGRLILLVKSWPSNTKLAKIVAASGLPVECKPLAERDLPRYLVEHAKREGLAKLESDAAARLVELSGNDLGVLIQELEKLATYVGDAGVIKTQDVLKLVGAGRAENAWRILDAVTTGRFAEAFENVEKLLESGESPIGLLAQMGFSLRRVHHAGMLRGARVPLDEACALAGINSYGVETTRRQHAHLGPARVGDLPRLLRETDHDLKGGSSLHEDFVFERFLVRLARPRTD